LSKVEWMQTTNMQAYKFVKTDSLCPDVLSGKSEQEFLRLKYQRGMMFGLDTLQKTGTYRLSGWSFNFRPFMKRFLYKRYGEWVEVYAPNKTSLRNSVYGRIQEIIEIQNKD